MQNKSDNTAINFAALIGLVILVLAFRIFGPSDLGLKDQPKTVSYTLDIVENGRWVWPHDMLGAPATKPPFYNWIGAGIVYVSGLTNELVLKLPTLIAGAGVFAMMYVFFASLVPATTGSPQTLSILSMLVFISNVSVYGLIYVARPDMMLACCLFTGWCCVSGLISDAEPVQERKTTLKILLWISFSIAILTKGPPAMLLPLYIVLIGIYQKRFKEVMSRCSFGVGIIAALLPVAIWMVAALDVESEYILGPLVSSEMDRVSSDLSWWDRIRDLYKMPFFFFVRFMPWTPFLIYFYWRFKDQIGKTSWMNQALIWVILVVVFFSFPTFKRDDYLLPAIPVAAILTGYFINQISTKYFPGIVLTVAYASVLLLGLNNIFFKEHLRSRHNEHVKHFASVVKEHVSGIDKLVFYDTGYHPLQSYLGRNQAAIKPSPADFERADWVVAPLDEFFRPETSIYRYAALEKVAESDLILKVGGQHEGKLGLFKILR